MLNRRTLLNTIGNGFGALALASILEGDKAFASDHDPRQGARPGIPHHPPKAKRVIQLFMAGAASHIDLFDSKPELIKQHGKPSSFGEKVETFQDGLGPWMQPPWAFMPYGECRKELGAPVARLGEVVDKIAFVHNMVGKTGVHSQSTYLQATGFQSPGFPGMGAWVSYGLGSMNENLPTFVVLPDHRGFASNGVKNWDSAFLPGQHAGTIIDPIKSDPIANLRPPASSKYITSAADADAKAALAAMNKLHAASHAGDDRLEARIRGYELAAGLQLAAPEAMNLADEPEHILKLYGLDHIPSEFPTEINAREEAVYFAKKCLTARRLLERGVRFVQIWSGNDNGFPRRNWDSHEDIKRDHGPLAEGMAVGASALIKDLDQRGLLEDTIILWTTEFGRMPSSQGGVGRDHNPYCFTNWLCGAGIKGGVSYGPSDDFGYKPADRNNPTQVYDIHATILHLLGIDHTRLTVRHGGIDRRLTDVHGHVIKDLLA